MPFGNDLEPEGSTEVHDRLEERAVDRALRQTNDEVARNLERVDREASEVRERRMPGAEVIECERKAKRAELVHARERIVRVLHDAVLGDLEDESSGGEPRPLEDLDNVVDQAVGHQLGGRQVHGDTHIIHSLEGVLPRLGLRACLTKHVPPDSDHETGLFGDRDEVVGADQPVTWPIPASECFECDRPARSEIDDRLVVDVDLSPLHRQRERRDRLLAVPHASMHLGSIGDVTALAGLLRVVHRDVCIAQELVGARHVRAAVGDSDARVHPHLASGNREGRFERSDQSSCEPFCSLVRAVAGQNRELVAAEPGRQVAGSHHTADTARDRDQELVTGVMAEAVVDRLEVVEIEKEHGRTRS